MQDNFQAFADAFVDALKPPKTYSVWEWADEFRYLSNKSSAEPGKWRTSRTPYLKQIMNCLSDNVPVNEIVFMKGAQIGGSECGNNWIAYTIEHSPAPMMNVLPSLEVAKRVSKQRIAPLIEESEALKKKVGSKKVRDSDNTILQKDFPGGTLILTGANSPAGLRSVPAKKLFLDEIDEYPDDVGGQGDPVSLAEKRTSTFGAKRKVYKCSTPTVEGKSRIAEAFEASTQNYFYVPCLECDGMQVLKFGQLKWPKGEPSKAKYECEYCGYQMANWQKTTMLGRGEWRPHNEKEDNKKCAGFHLSSLYSPVGWLDWVDIAKEWVEIQRKKDPNRLKAFVNTVLGETWKEKSEVPEWNRLYERREPYEIGTVPKGVAFLTAGVDVQGDRLEVEVVGWGRDFESWSICYRVITGNPSEEETWRELDALLSETFPYQPNERIRLPIKMMAVDTGYKTQAVYNWIRKKSQTKVSAIKGRDDSQMIIGLPRAVDVNWKGRLIKRGLKVWSVGVTLLKEELYGWLRQNAPSPEEPAPHGFCHFPEYGQEFFKQLTAEKLVTKMKNGYSEQEWEKHRERNEALDCRVYARAAASICGIDRFTEPKWKEMEAHKGQPAPSQEVQQRPTNNGNSSGQQNTVGGIVRRKSSFL